MTPRSSGTRWRALGALGFVWLSIAGAEPPATVDASALQACTRLTADAERLACYDRLAGRGSAPAATAGNAANRPAPTSAAPAASAATATSAAPVTSAATAAAAATAATAATAGTAAPAGTAATAAPPPGTTFGRYEAEHPHPAVAASLEAPIAAVGKSASGHMTISVEGGAIWELDEPDPLLRVGDVVSITRAALGSYILHTPTRRTHRVRRLN